MLTVTEARQRIADNTEALAARYWAREDVAELVRTRTMFFDELLRDLWQQHLGESTHVALLAVGGYGRGELHPESDIDLLVIAKNPKRHATEISDFLRDVFDLNIEVGHAVRTVRDCKQKAADDITIATALYERRHLAGDDRTSAALDKVMSSSRLWPSPRFYRAKADEQAKRHKQYDNVDYGLEPNLKSSPGGLRDYHTAMWVCLRHFGTNRPEDLVQLGALTAQEAEWLTEGRRYLWWVRFGLHLLAGRKEDRLQFEHQRELARRLGFADTEAQLGVERFMHTYYRHVLALREVNDILLQHFEEQIFAGKRHEVTEINERFRLHNDYIEIVDEGVFEKRPSALLELFVILANRPDIAGVRADTIRAIRDSLHLIDDDFRADPEVNKLFIALLKAPHTLVSQLTRMRRYGVLGRYIPEFGRVVGQMQHDLFHIYTVDQHTMMVIRNMRRFFYRSSAETFPVASHCVKKIPKIELLYLAGLFHDIAKGRGGDHSSLGAQDVTTFCRRHRLSKDDTELVRWLVDKHLVMSSVAQREDIYDPDVVYEFACEVKSERRLDYLYALTVADINATNPTLWNGYRATLLRHLYGATRRTLRRGLESPIDKRATLAATKERAEEMLLQEVEDLSPSSLQAFWDAPGLEFFLRHSARHIANISKHMVNHDPGASPLVVLANITLHVADETLTEVYLYTTDRPGLFWQSTAALGKLGLSVFEANINTARDGVCFNSYVVLDSEGKAVPPRRHPEIVESLTQLLEDGVQEVQSKRMPRQHKQLKKATECYLHTGDGNNFSTLEVHASDRPGLLAEIGGLFRDFGIAVLSARITTLGEKVEDLFEIQTLDGKALNDEQAYELEQAIRQGLDWHLQQAM